MTERKRLLGQKRGKYNPTKKKGRDSHSSWWDDYSFDSKSYSYDVDSGSRSWRSKLTSWSYKPKEQTKEESYRKLLRQLQNSAGLLSEGKVAVRWSSGSDRNDGKDETIYLSPNGLIEGKDGVQDEVTDALTGKVYLATTLHKTAHVEARTEAREARKDQPLPHKLWQAIETSIARKDVMENWSGFMPYIVSDSERTCSSKTEVQEFVDSTGLAPQLNAAVLLLSWSLVNGGDPLTVPPLYGPMMDAAAEEMKEQVRAEDRFGLARRMVQKMKDALPQAPKSESGESESGESESESGSGEESNESESGEESGEAAALAQAGGSAAPGKGEVKEMPKGLRVTDPSLFGEKVSNEEGEDLAKMAISEGEVSSKGGEGGVDIPYAGYGHPDQMELAESPVMDGGAVMPTAKAEYKEEVYGLRNEIESVRSAFSFLRVRPSMASFGHRSGDLDEGSFYKMSMGDDRIMSEKDVISDPVMAVCVLLDESGSMMQGDYAPGSDTWVNRADMAREVAIVLAEGLKDLPGVDLTILGHTAEDSCGDHRGYHGGVILRRYLSPNYPYPETLMGLSARSENHDGYAIQHAANLFFEENRMSDRRIMFVVSDGYPCGSGYYGRPAAEHMKKVSEACRLQLKVEVYGIGIDNAFSSSAGARMYGEGNSVVLQDVKSSLHTMVGFLRRAAVSMKRR